METNEQQELENNVVEQETDSTEFNFKDVEKHRLLVGICYLLAIGSLWLPWYTTHFGTAGSVTANAFWSDGAILIAVIAAGAAIAAVLIGGMKNKMSLVAKIVPAVIGVLGLVFTFVVADEIDFGRNTSAAWGSYVTMATFILGVVAAFIPASIIEKIVPDSLGAYLDETADE